MPAIDSAYTVINSIPLVEQSSAPTTPASGKRTVFVKSDGVYDVDDAGTVTGPFGASGAGTLNDYINIQDQKAQNTAGGTFTAGSWATRDLNTEVADSGGHASVASNQITLAAGTYTFKITAVAFRVSAHKVRLYDITNAATIGYGLCAYSWSGDNTSSNSVVAGQFTVAGSTVFEVQHKCETTEATNGFGQPTGDTEVYCIAEFWKVA